ncbi:g3315 [Coccomyxa elongata]
MLDNQAARTAQECMDRYLLNTTLLAHIFHGPEGNCRFPGSTTALSGLKECLKACSRDEVTPEVESFGRGSPEGRGEPCSEHDPVDDSARVANNLEGEAGCHTISVKGEVDIAGAKSGTEHRPSRKRKHTMIAPGVHRVELCKVDEVFFPMGPDEDTIHL